MVMHAAVAARYLHPFQIAPTLIHPNTHFSAGLMLCRMCFQGQELVGAVSGQVRLRIPSPVKQQPGARRNEGELQLQLPHQPLQASRGHGHRPPQKERRGQ